MTADGLGIAGFDALPEDRARQALLECCAAPEWVRAVLAGRPYGSADALYEAADTALAALSEDDIDRALDGHPRIGDRPDSAASAREQAGATAADDRVKAALAAGNREYEAKFGHIYLVCASGKSGDELLALLRARLTNDPETERRVMRTELAKINRIRLGGLLG